MSARSRLFSSSVAVLFCVATGCATRDPGSLEGDPFGLETMDDAPKTGESPAAAAAPVPAGPAAADGNKPAAFLLRDGEGRKRVTGTLHGARMEGLWTYFDPAGRKVAAVTYLSDARHGPVTLYYVSGDGAAAGRKRMTGLFSEGAPQGVAMSYWPNKKKKLEREFDRGLLENCVGWREDGTEMTDAEAQSAALDESRTEDALFSELEAFVQLHARRRSPAAS